MKTTGFNILYAVSFFEGAALMAIEPVTAKMIAPYFGTSVYVWACVLGCTLGALALGYFSGGSLSKKLKSSHKLYLIILLAGLLVLALPLIATVQETTVAMTFQIGLFVSALLLIFPPVFLFGMVSPMIIQLVSIENSENKAATVYAVSTAGGIAAVFCTTFYLIPYRGLRFTCFLMAGLLLIWPLLNLCVHLFQKNRNRI